MAITISGENNNDRILAADGVIDQISGINIVGLITASHINVGSNIQLGNAGIVTATTFVGNLTGNVNSTSPLLLQTGGSERFRITGNNELGIAGANYGSSGQVLTSGGSGSAVTWSTIPTQATINNNAADRIITGEGGTTLNGEATLVYNGSLGLGINNPARHFHLHVDSSAANYQLFTNSTTGANNNDGLLLGITAAEEALFWNYESTPSRFATSGTERLRIASDGKIFVANEAGTIDTTARLGEGHRFQLSGLSSNDGISVVRYNSSYGAWGLNLGRSKSNTLGTNVALQDNDDIGHVTFWGADGSDFNKAAQISAEVDGTPSSGTDMPGALVFKTSAEASGTPTERLRIGSDGKVGFNNPTLDNDFVFKCGTGAHTVMQVRSASESTKFTIQTVQDSDVRVGTVSDHPLNVYTNSLTRVHIHDDGWCMLNTSTLGSSKTAKELIISYNNDGVSGGDQGRAGMTIRSGNNSSNAVQNGYIYFSDGTSGDNESKGGIVYEHSNDAFYFATNNTEKLRITDGGDVTTTGTSTFARTNAGFTARSGDSVSITRAGGTPLEITRTTNQGNMINFLDTNGTTYRANIGLDSNDLVFGLTDEKLRITSGGQILIGTTSSLSFNGAGGNHNLVVAGDSNDTDITDNYNAAITISNKDGTANNTAGLHFAREDTDGNPHYDGASVVAQFKETMNTGQYPKADLVFLTSTANNNAPSEKLRIAADGNVGINQATPTRAKLHVVGPSSSGTEIVAKFKGASGSDARTKIGLVAAYPDAVNDTEGHAYVGALRNGSGNSTTLFFEVSQGSSLRESARVHNGGIQATSFRFTSNASTDAVLPNTHNIGDVSSNSISYYHNPGLYYIVATCPTDGNWYTMFTSFNDSASNFRGVCGDASSKNSFYWYFNPTSPSYGVNPYGEKWHHGAWNTGSVTFRLDGTHPNWNLQIKCTSHYGTNRTAALRGVLEVYY